MRLIASLVILLTVLCSTTAAWAHASLVSAEPNDGSVLAAQPQTVQLRFNEIVTPIAVQLVDAQGRARADTTLRAMDQTLVLTLPENLPRGTQVVSYRVISADGHPVGGSVLFSIGEITSGANGSASTNIRAMPIWLARIGVYVGLFAGVGGVFFGAWISRSRAGATVVAAALILGIVGSVVSLGLQGLDVLDLAFGALATLAPWQAALATTLAPSLMVAVLAMVASLVVQRSAAAGAMARGLSALALAGAGLSLALSGHAATAPPTWLTRPAIVVHGMAVAYWAGALMPLTAMAHGRMEALLPVLNRFSRWAIPIVGFLVLTGLILAIIQLGNFRGLIDTKYGLVLSIKLVLVVILLGLAALNRFKLTPALAVHPEHTRPITRSLVLECAVVFAILAVVAGWRFTPPPRALAAASHPPLALHIHTNKAMFQVLVSPGHAGVDSFVLQLMTGEGALLPAKEATLSISLPQRGIEPLERKAALGPDGYWHVDDMALPYPGRWHIRVEALVSDFERITLEEDLTVPGPTSPDSP